MRLIYVLLGVLHFLLQSSCSVQDDEMLPRIGIIGAGISGTSAAYFLRQLFGEKAIIDVFESNKVGGRTAVIKINGQHYEAGGSVIHKKNRYMVNFAEKFNKSAMPVSASSFGLYGDSGIVFQTSNWLPITLAKLVWRYGLSLYTLREWTHNMVENKFNRIYDFQEKGMAFTTVEDLLRAMGEDMVNMTRHSLVEVLNSAGLSPRFIDELAMAAMRNNYGQTTSVHGFVGAVSLIGAEPALWSVLNGNKEIPEALLHEAKVSFIEAQVNTVALMKDELGTGSVTYEVEYEKKNSGDKSSTDSKEYDIVIVAAPIEGSKSKISFDGFPNQIPSFSQKYHSTTAMFVQGSINKTTFNIQHHDEFPSDLFTINPDIFFNSIGKPSPVDPQQSPDQPFKPGQAVWKTFLNKVPSEEQTSLLFEDRQDIRMVNWLAYPEYTPNLKLPPFQLFDRLYYVNAIESAAAAMEMNVIGSRNVALLAFNQWHGNFDKIDEPHLPPDNDKGKSEL